MSQSREEPGWTSQFRVLINAIDLNPHDVREDTALHDPSDYGRSQDVARNLRNAGSDGICYRGVRSPGEERVAIFSPDLIPVPILGDHFDYFWDGERVDRVRNCRTGAIFAL
jgi:hypothetical protein